MGPPDRDDHSELLREAIPGAGGTVANNAPNDELPERLQKTLGGDELLLLLNEADDIAGVDAVGQLTAVPGVEVVVICHEPDDWLARAESGVRQYLHGGRIELDRFGVDELADILRDRARVGLVDDVVTREQLETIADDVAGVARGGIQTLRAAAEIAVERGHGRIHDADIDDADERARSSIRGANLQSLPFHYRVLYELIRDAGGITGSFTSDTRRSRSACTRIESGHRSAVATDEGSSTNYEQMILLYENNLIIGGFTTLLTSV